jgi:hypothetical protein
MTMCGSSIGLATDFTQATDLAAQNPEKVKELQAAFLEEAKKYNVLPLDGRMSERFDASLRPNPLAGLKSFSYGPGTTNISKSAVLNTHGVAQIETTGASDDGVLAAIGGISSGWMLYLKDGKPASDYNFFEVERYRTGASAALPRGKSTVRVDFTPVEPGPAKPATVKLFSNGKQTGESRVEKTVPFRYSVEPFDVGMDNVSPASVAVPFQGPH